jgi:hypothetical protein
MSAGLLLGVRPAYFASRGSVELATRDVTPTWAFRMRAFPQNSKTFFTATEAGPPGNICSWEYSGLLC